MSDSLKIRKWDEWQTYRKGRGQPPWIKVYRALLRDPDWVALNDAQRGQLVAIWMLAADHDGAIPASPTIIKKLCFMDSEPDLQTFTDHGFIEGRRRVDAKTATNGRQDGDSVTPQSRVEESREEKSRLAPNDGAALTPEILQPEQPIQIIIRGWKIQSGVDPDDKAWDETQYKRHLRPARDLLKQFSGDVDAALDCIETVYKRLVESQGLDLSLQGVVNNSGRFRQEWQERNARLEKGAASGLLR